jgi:hypothetical protein
MGKMSQPFSSESFFFHASHSGRLEGEGGSEQTAEENNYTCEI